MAQIWQIPALTSVDMSLLMRQMNEGRYRGRTWVRKCESHLSLHWALAESAEVISSVNSCTSWTFLFFKRTSCFIAA